MPDNDTITITCIYCGHTWSERIADLEAQDTTIYRLVDEHPKSRTVNYLVTCPNCGQRMVVTIQVREATDE